MQSSIRLSTKVLPGGKIEISHSQLHSGDPVDVIVVFPDIIDTCRRSVVEILAEAPGRLAFHSPAEVDAYIREEREAWER